MSKGVIREFGNPPWFIVGCSRGGTTVLQSLITANSDRLSFPETNILYRVCGDLTLRRFGYVLTNGWQKIPVQLSLRVLNRLGITHSFPRRAFERFLSAIGRQDLIGLVPERTFSIARTVDCFRTVLDEISGGKPWVEKTPQHVFCLDILTRYMPDAKFIHIVRDGRENVASLYVAGKEYRDFKDRFGGPRGLDNAVRYWNRALRCTSRFRSKRGHMVIRYEDLILDPERVMEEIAAFLGVTWLGEFDRVDSGSHILPDEEWKQGYGGRVSRQPSRFDQLSSTEQCFIESRILNVDEYVPRTGGAGAFV